MKFCTPGGAVVQMWLFLVRKCIIRAWVWVEMLLLASKATSSIDVTIESFYILKRISAEPTVPVIPMQPLGFMGGTSCHIKRTSIFVAEKPSIRQAIA